MASKKYFLAIFSVFLSIFSVNLSADFLDDVVAEINYVRTRPQEYALKRLTPRLKNYKGLDYYLNPKLAVVTKEGAKACKECIEVLKKQKPLPPLTMDDVLCKAASAHMKDQSKSGQVGHEGRDGSHSKDRIKKAGFEGEITGENISYGATTAIDIVANLMIDDGVPDRGHRDNLLDTDFEKIGVAYAKGPKVAHGSICVIDFGGFDKGQQNIESSKQNSNKKGGSSVSKSNSGKKGGSSALAPNSGKKGKGSAGKAEGHKGSGSSEGNGGGKKDKEDENDDEVDDNTGSDDDDGGDYDDDGDYDGDYDGGDYGGDYSDDCD